MRAAWPCAAALVLLLGVAGSRPQEDWSVQDLSGFGEPADFAASRAICARVIRANPPPADMPTPAERKALKGCDSEALYYGIGMPADPVKARKCAILELGDDPAPVALFTGEGMLTMVYANGRGAPRNLNIAIHMACQMSDAAAAMDFRIKHLDELRRKGWKGQDFESCYDITSGVSGGICADHYAKLGEQTRQQRIARLKQGWPREQAALFDRAYAAFSAYADTEHEMDCFRGTAAAQCEIDGQQQDIERFLKRIEALAQGKTPAKDASPEGGLRPATDHSGWKEAVDDMDAEDREWYVGNREEAVAARAKFEQALVAFARAAFPARTPHQIREMFSDL